MKLHILASCVLVGLLGSAHGQTYLGLMVDARPPVNFDNHAELIVVQPSRHGPVTVQPLQTGPTGWVALAVLSMDGDYSKDNQSLLSSFVSLDIANHLILPSPVLSELLNTLALAGPFVAGVHAPLQLPVNASSSAMAETAFYYQCAAVNPLSPIPGGLQMQWSNGVTLVQAEAPGTYVDGVAASISEKLGSAFAVGDFNGDGVDDLAIAAPGATAGARTQAGRVQVHLGIARTVGVTGGLHPVPYLLQEQVLAGAFANPGPQTDAGFGTTIVAADVDGDGAADLVIGAPDAGADRGVPFAGEVFVLTGLGAALGGPPSLPITVKLPPSSIRTLRPQTEQADARFGFRLAARDLDGDGKAEIAVGTPFFDAGAATNAGRVEIFNLASTAPGAAVSPAFVLADDVVQAQDRFGSALHFAEIDGFGAPELIVGVPGQVKAGVPGAGKIDILTWIGGVPVISAVLDHPTPESFASFGCAISSADLDGNGTDEVAISSEDEAGGMPRAGVVRVVSGLGTVSPTFVQALQSPSPQINERFGTSVIFRDMNADGVADFVIGAPGCPSVGQMYGGQVFVSFGAKNLVPTHPAFRSLHVKAPTVAAYSFFGAAIATGDFADVGVQDLVVGAPGFARSGMPAAGSATVHTDLLHRRDNRHRSYFIPTPTP